MSEQTIGIIMNGVSGRMGYRQHLVRSILAIREQGGVLLSDGTRVQVEPILVGRSEAKLAELAAKHGIENYTTNLDEALADPRWQIYSDFLVTRARSSAIRKAIAAGKAHLHREADGRELRGVPRTRPPRLRGRHQERCRARQALPARACRSSSA